MHKIEHILNNAYNLKSNISFLLTFRNINQTDLAKLIGTTRRIVNSWLNTDANIPTEMLAILSKEFKITIDTLVFGDKKDVEKELLGYKVEEDHASARKIHENLENDINKVTMELSELHFEDSTFLANLIRGLSRNHEKLLNDPIYQLYVGRIITDYKTEQEKQLAREEVAKDTNGSVTKG